MLQPRNWILYGHIIRPASRRVPPSTLVISMDLLLNSNDWQLSRVTLSSRQLGGFSWNIYREVWKPGLMVCSHLPNMAALNNMFLYSEQAFEIPPVCWLSECSCFYTNSSWYQLMLSIMARTLSYGFWMTLLFAWLWTTTQITETSFGLNIPLNSQHYIRLVNSPRIPSHRTPTVLGQWNMLWISRLFTLFNFELTWACLLLSL